MDAFYDFTFWIVIIGSFTASVEIIGGLFRKGLRVEHEVQDYKKEIEILNLVLGESEKIIDNAGQVPKSARRVHSLCISYRNKLDTALVETRPLSNVKLIQNRIRLMWSEKEWKEIFRVYKDSVFILRDLCADIKTDLGMRNMLAAMALLNEEFATAPHGYQHQNLVELHNNNYCMVAYVLESASNSSDDSEPMVGPAEAGPGTDIKSRLVPARLKIDTGADVDHVSKDFLTVTLGKNEHEFDPIPEENQVEITGFDGNKYTPCFSIKLKWSRGPREGTKEHEFLIIDGSPCDMVLGSKNFLEQAARVVQVAVSRNKSKASIELQGQKNKDNDDRRKKKSHAEFEEEAAHHPRRSVTERFSTGTATATDVEMGNLGEPAPSSHPQGPLQDTAQNDFGEQAGQGEDRPTPRFGWLRRRMKLLGV